MPGEDTNFDHVVDRLRRSLALQYVKERHISLPQIAWLLGYEGPTSFNYAIARWTARSASEVRNEEQEPDSPRPVKLAPAARSYAGRKRRPRPEHRATMGTVGSGAADEVRPHPPAHLGARLLGARHRRAASDDSADLPQHEVPSLAREQCTWPYRLVNDLRRETIPVSRHRTVAVPWTHVEWIDVAASHLH
jgi:hypothetical protein